MKAGDVILEIENEKAVTEIVAPADGIVKYVAWEGEVVPVRGVLGRVLALSEARAGGASAEVLTVSYGMCRPALTPWGKPTSWS